MKHITEIMQQIPEWAWGVLFFIVWVMLMMLVKKSVFKRLAKWAARTQSTWDDVFLKTLSFPANLLVIVVGLQFVEVVFGFTPAYAKYIEAVGLLGIVLAIAYFLDRFVVGMIRKRELQSERFRSYSGIAKTVAHVFIYVIGFMVVLDSLGVSITPIIASLGVGSIAIALALQDTLANLFSGLYVLIDQPISVGQYIRLSSGEEGFVEHIGWRSTRIRKLPNNIIIIPNNHISNTTITNYHLPVSELSVVVPVGVHYGSDLEMVERVTVEVAKDVLQTVEGGVPEFEPFIRFFEFADSSINFRAILRAKDYSGKFLVTHEFVKRLQKRYAVEGIVIPFPIRTIEFAEGANAINCLGKNE